MLGETTNDKFLGYAVAGRYELWIFVGVENDRIKNIYIARGNMTALILPAILYAGEGPSIGQIGIDID